MFFVNFCVQRACVFVTPEETLSQISFFPSLLHKINFGDFLSFFSGARLHHPTSFSRDIHRRFKKHFPTSNLYGCLRTP